MAVSSMSAILIPSLPLTNSSPFPSSKLNVSSFALPSANNALKLRALRPSQSSTRVYAAPEVLESQETLVPPPETLEVYFPFPFFFFFFKFSFSLILQFGNAMFVC